MEKKKLYIGACEERVNITVIASTPELGIKGLIQVFMEQYLGIEEDLGDITEEVILSHFDNDTLNDFTMDFIVEEIDLETFEKKYIEISLEDGSCSYRNSSEIIKEIKE